MQKLHLVGLTTDMSGLIFSARKGSKSGGYVVPVDARLLAVIADTLTRRNGDAPTGVGVSALVPDSASAATDPAPAPVVPPRPTSALSPREIQSRLRAGRTVDEIAKEARVDVEWVERFAVPILAEQGRVVERAVHLFYTKPRVGVSALPLAGAVRRNLIDRGVRLTDDEFDAGWSAFHLEDTRWAVRFRYRSRGRAQLAEWEIDIADGGIAARNRLAGQLAHATRGRRRARPVVAQPAKKKPAAAKKSTAAKKGATMKRAPARPRPRPAR